MVLLSRCHTVIGQSASSFVVFAIKMGNANFVAV